MQNLTHASAYCCGQTSTDLTAKYTNADFGSVKLVGSSSETLDAKISANKLGVAGLTVDVDAKDVLRSYNTAANVKVKYAHEKLANSQVTLDVVNVHNMIAPHIISSIGLYNAVLVWFVLPCTEIGDCGCVSHHAGRHRRRVCGLLQGRCLLRRWWCAIPTRRHHGLGSLVRHLALSALLWFSAR